MSVARYLDKLEDLNSKKIIVTGGTSGIGLSIVKHLLKKNAHVVVLARNINKAQKVKESFLLTYPNNPIEIIYYDQGKKESIINASKEIIAHHHDFYALICNAGVFAVKKETAYIDNIPQTINTNYVGLNILLDNLLPYLNEPHRIVIQGSLVAGWKCRKIKSLKEANLRPFSQYILSKCGVEATYYHYSKLNNPNLSFYLVEPGLTSTDIVREFPTPIKQMGKVFLKVFSHSNDKAALTAMLALQSNVDKNSYIVPRGLLTYMGYPKIKRFPHKRERENLYQLYS